MILKKRLVRSVLVFCVLFVVIGLLIFFPLGEVESEPEMEIYLVFNPIHADLVLPLKNHVYDWEQFIDPSHYEQKNGEWIEIGWGDRDFYFKVPTWDKFTIGVGLDAMMTPDPGIIHLNYLHSHPSTFKSAIKIEISYARYALLVRSIKDQFITKNNAPVLIPGRGYGKSDNFYEARGQFWMFKTCNVWTAQRLGDVGLKRPLWSPFIYGLEFVWKK